jgi:hypothetical protein
MMMEKLVEWLAEETEVLEENLPQCRFVHHKRHMWDFVMDKSGAGAGFLREIRFPLPIYIPSASPQSSSLSPEAGTIGQEWPQCQ